MASGGTCHVSILRALIKTSLALALTSVTFFTAPASGQSPAGPQAARLPLRNPDKAVQRTGLSASYFVEPKKVMLYGRGSWVRGQFGDSYEYGGGVKWFFLPTERLWLNTELFRVNKAPYSGAFTPYTAGMSGWVPPACPFAAFCRVA
jgi:hypothetical protein